MMTKEYRNYGESQKNIPSFRRTEWWIALSLCVAVIMAGALEQLIGNRTANDGAFAPVWLPFAAGVIAAAGIIRLNGYLQWHRIQQVFLWSGLFLLVWVANGLPLDLLRLTPLIPLGVDWPGMVTKIVAFTAVIVLVRLALARPVALESPRTATWYGYAAFLLALPYPVLRTCWAMGGTLGLTHAGAAGHGWVPWLACIPWLLAAVLSLLLISSRQWMPRRLLLVAGWTATAIVAMIGPAACWSLVTNLIRGGDPGIEGIATWIPYLFYGSWLLWAIAAGAATRSYQLRSAFK
jgi:hypothetical protein